MYRLLSSQGSLRDTLKKDFKHRGSQGLREGELLRERIKTYPSVGRGSNRDSSPSSVPVVTIYKIVGDSGNFAAHGIS